MEFRSKMIKLKQDTVQVFYGPKDLPETEKYPYFHTPLNCEYFDGGFIVNSTSETIPECIINDVHVNTLVLQVPKEVYYVHGYLHNGLKVQPLDILVKPDLVGTIPGTKENVEPERQIVIVEFPSNIFPVDYNNKTYDDSAVKFSLTFFSSPINHKSNQLQIKALFIDKKRFSDKVSYHSVPSFPANCDFNNQLPVEMQVAQDPDDLLSVIENLIGIDNDMSLPIGLPVKLFQALKSISSLPEYREYTTRTFNTMAILN